MSGYREDLQLIHRPPRPILTPKTVLPLFFAVGIIFAPIGGLLLYASAQVSELESKRLQTLAQSAETRNIGSRALDSIPTLRRKRPRVS